MKKKQVLGVVVLVIVLAVIASIIMLNPSSGNRYATSTELTVDGCSTAANTLNSWNAGWSNYTLQPGVPQKLYLDFSACSSGVQNLNVYVMAPRVKNRTQMGLKNANITATWKNLTVGCQGAGVAPYYDMALYSWNQLPRTSALSQFEITLTLDPKSKGPVTVSPNASWAWAGEPLLPVCN